MQDAFFICLTWYTYIYIYIYTRVLPCASAHREERWNWSEVDTIKVDTTHSTITKCYHKFYRKFYHNLKWTRSQVNMCFHMRKWARTQVCTCFHEQRWARAEVCTRVHEQKWARAEVCMRFHEQKWARAERWHGPRAETIVKRRQGPSVGTGQERKLS